MTSLRLHEADNIVVARTDLAKGDVAGGCRVKQNIPAAHKMAIDVIAKGEPVRKYGHIIGYASVEIAAGSHVHSHNLAYGPAPLKHDFCAGYRSTDFVPDERREFFNGYHRANGAVGTRNMIAVLSMVNCSAMVARSIARAFTPEVLAGYANIDGVAAFTSGTGCGMSGSGEGFDILQRVIGGYARNPNIGGGLLVGLGCEINQIDFLLEAYGISPGPAFQVMNIQTLGGTAKSIRAGVERIRDMLPEVNRARRRSAPLSRLMLGLQCGGSDGLSGITANPALGHACDLLVAQGGTVVLSETPEIYGAEHLLTRRAASPDIARKLLARVAWWQEYVARNKGSMDNNPSPGNKAGGLTTILEKSLGA
ncbi:MAG TPA: altronate dehydratase, partial [Rhodobacteraceae bacterium]|nr:altronate dehydratase [Paracoccaceae bacterium]